METSACKRQLLFIYLFIYLFTRFAKQFHNRHKLDWTKFTTYNTGQHTTQAGTDHRGNLQ